MHYEILEDSQRILHPLTAVSPVIFLNSERDRRAKSGPISPENPFKFRLPFRQTSLVDILSLCMLQSTQHPGHRRYLVQHSAATNKYNEYSK
jgi:hypothetical protein